MLTHEEYHVKITDVGTTKLNHEIEKEKLTYVYAIERQIEINQETWDLQEKYDSHTFHSIYKPIQHYWEYKIDSLLNDYVDINNEDIFTGASAYFSAEPKVIVTLDSTTINKSYKLDKYNASFGLTIHYDIYPDTLNLINKFNVPSAESKSKDISINFTNQNDTLIYDIKHQNAANSRIYFQRIVIFDLQHYFSINFDSPPR